MIVFNLISCMRPEINGESLAILNRRLKSITFRSKITNVSTNLSVSNKLIAIHSAD